MANENDLVMTLTGQKRVWSPSQLCQELGVHVIELIRLIDKARQQGFDIEVVKAVETGNSGKVFLRGDHV